MTQIVSSISGIEIYAPSAGNAPTNSSEVSAIASAYQVVSATATQLYAGTSFLTSVNSTPVSASRAGNAANASLATSAWYDGTGRLISALPDNAAVSSIASGYVTGVSATVANNSASWGGGGGSVVSPSGTIFVNNGNQVEGTNSAVVVEQTSMGVTSTLTPQLNAIGPTGMGVLTYDYPDESGMNLVFEMDHAYHGADATVVISGRDNNWNMASASGLIVEGDTSANIPLGPIASQLSASSDYWINLVYGQDLSAVKAPGYAVTGVGELAWNSALTGVSSTVASHSAFWEQGGVDSATVSSIASSYAESAASSKLDSTAQVVSATAGDGTYVTSINGMGISGQGGGGGSPFPADIVTGGTVRAVVTTGFQDNTSTRPTLFISSNPSYTEYPRMLLSENHSTTSQNKSSTFLADAFEFYTAGGTKVWRADRNSVSSLSQYVLNSANVSGNNWTVQSGVASGGTNTSKWWLNRNGVSGVTGDTSWQYTTAEYEMLTSVNDTVSSNSASWGGVDSATVSSIASSYAQDVSAAVSGTVDTVSSQSANWGGSALALSAGPGVKLEKVGDTLVASTDETVLFSGSSVAADMNLSESPNNFAYMRVEYRRSTSLLGFVSSVTLPVNSASVSFPLMLSYGNVDNSTAYNEFIVRYNGNTTATTFSFQYALKRANTVGGGVTIATDTAPTLEVFKVVGINRTAGV